MKYLKEYGLLLLLFIGLTILLVLYYIKDTSYKTINLNVVPTMISKIDNNSVWCPTLELIWNDLKNEVIKQDVVFINDKDNIMVNDLNKETFTSRMISDEYYYKTYGYATIKLKNEIIKNIENKFKEKSDILDNFDFHEVSNDYFFYSMLVRNFTFKYPFDLLDENTFGINSDSDSKLYENVEILFYNDENNYAIKLLTKSNDEVILYKGPRKDNFLETYQSISKEKVEPFNKNDTLIVSNFDFKTEFEYPSLCNKEFFDVLGQSYVIDKVIQTIKFKLDNTGGKIKSEAGISMKNTAFYEKNPRIFDFSDDFLLFLKEKDKDLPYFAINISDINSFR